MKIQMITISKPLISEEEKMAVLKVLDSGHIVQGPVTQELEKMFAKECNVKHAVAVTNGTAALHIALHSAGIVPGDEVITTPFTFAATANSILMCGAKPVFCDIEPETFNIDPKQIEKKITKKTKAIIPVDLYGHPHDYSKIYQLAKKHNIIIIEDAAQAVGAMIEDKKAGSFGDAACFSLYATKNIMSGEGGIVTTNNDDIAEKAKRFRNHGQGDRYDYLELGYNYRTNDICAAIGVEQLKKLEMFTTKRIMHARHYDESLKHIKGLILPTTKKGIRHVFHQYTIRVTKDFSFSRDELKDLLKSEGIICGIYYPKPLHLQPSFSIYKYKEGDFPESEKAAKEVLSLPVHPGLSSKDIDVVIHAIDKISKIRK